MVFAKCDWNEDIWKGASAGCGVFCAFVSACAKEFGWEKVSAILKGLGESMGSGVGQMFKDQLGNQKLDVEKLSKFVIGFNGPFGCQMEIERHPSFYRLRHHNCPMAAGCKSFGIDYEFMKRVCEDWGAVLFKSVMKVLAPTGQYELSHLRENFDDYCEERYTLGTLV